MSFRRVILLGCIGLQTLVAHAEYRTFTDAATGRTLEAELIRYDAASQKVSLKLKERGTKTVPISLFIEEDRAYIIAWDKNQDFLSDHKLKVDFNRRKTKNTDLTSEYYSMTRKYYDCNYRITIKNNSAIDFKNVTLEYVIFYTQDKHINSNRDTEEQHGTLYLEKKINLPKKSTQEIETDKLTLYTYRESDYINPWPPIDSDVEGIMVTLSMTSDTGETISKRLQSPDNLSVQWTTKTKDVQIRTN